MHDMAFGVSIPDKNLSLLHKKANQDLSKIDFGESCYNVNFIRNAQDKDIESLIFDLSKYEDCFGQQNEAPLMAIENLFLSQNEYSVCGKNKDTVRFQKNDITYIKFHAKELIEQLSNYQEMKMTIIGEPAINEWMGVQSAQIKIKDIEIEDDNDAF